ncbi:MAG TPA: NAD-binding protein [bacterium]|nr:NAD-binding protein [bacterium]HPG47386.1 NAD-binding protein [bacterium]HPM99701.1 NAD-binding protein [bacterium]
MLSWTIRFWKHALMLITLSCAFVCFLSSDLITANGIARVLQAFYFSLGIFILAGFDIGFPANTSSLPNLLLWICYFLAPLLTASFVYSFVQEKLLKKLNPHYKNHTVICGFGKSGKLVYELARAHYPKKHKIVVIECNPDNLYRTELSKKPTVWWICGNFTDELVLKKARGKYASEIIITTNHDFANLKAIFTMKSMLDPQHPLRIFCHIGDPKLHSAFKNTLRDKELSSRVKFFNAYDVVTRRLAANWLQNPPGDQRPRSFILVGLGRFGRLLLQNILTDSSLTGQDEIAIVTLNPSYDVQRLKYHWPRGLNPKPRILEPIIDTIQNPSVWQRLNQQFKGNDKNLFVILCRDDDIANLETAISLKTGPVSPLRQSTIVCRIFSKTVKAMSDSLEKRITENEQRDIRFFPFQDELKEALREEIFEK